MSSSCCCSLKPKLKSVVSLMELTNRGYQLARVHTNIVIHHRAPTNLHLSPWFTCRCLLIAAELVPLVGFSPPVFAPSMPGRRPSSSRKGAFQFPQDIGYQENSKCQRSSKLCCSQRNIGSQYECFHHHGCSENIATIISTCS